MRIINEKINNNGNINLKFSCFTYFAERHTPEYSTEIMGIVNYYISLIMDYFICNTMEKYMYVLQ